MDSALEVFAQTGQWRDFVIIWYREGGGEHVL